MEEKKLPVSVYRALEDIVGPEFISDDPAVLESYSWAWSNIMLFKTRYTPIRPLAVVLPGSAEEVQAIVKTCNKFKIKFRAHATGFGPHALTSSQPFLVIDLRRLNRILLIDEKNMIAVVEPYVSHAELFYECIKKGLRFNAIGAGPSASVVASSCCHDGTGFHALSAHYDGQNVVGAEWVLPNGEIIRLGSMATDSGWFTADGPGLSLRAIMRGRGGANGGLGIITKAAVKLAPWYGPPRLEVKGEPPLYECTIPENFRLYLVSFPSIEKLVEFLRFIAEERIAFGAFKPITGSTTFLHVTTESNEQAYEKYKLKKHIVDKIACSVVILLDAISSKEIEFKEMCFRKILQLTNGEIIPLDKQEESALFAELLLGFGVLRECFRAAGAFAVHSYFDGSYEACVRVAEATQDILLRSAEQGRVFYSKDQYWLVPFGDQWAHLEQVYVFDPNDPESLEAVREAMGSILKIFLEQKYGIWGEGFINMDDLILEITGPHCFNYHLKIRAIKKALDPNLVSESTWYTTPRE